MLVIGLGLMLTRTIGLDQVFFVCGLIFAALGCGDIFYDSRYKRRYK